jgi:hypothetical protein
MSFQIAENNVAWRNYLGLSLLLICLTVGARSTPSQTQRLELPSEARDMLYLKFPEWRYAEISDEVQQAFKQAGNAQIRHDLISGDFDGDGHADYAALILHGMTRVQEGNVVGPEPVLVIFMAQDHGYRLYVIEDPGGEYLELAHKGDRRYDFEAQKEFTLEHDAIEAIVFEKAATSYVFEQGRFRAIITGD